MMVIENMNFSYSNSVKLFECLNLNLEAGHVYGLLGKNGAGKSTLLKNMTGLAFPQQGRCLLNNRDVTKRSAEVLEEVFFLSEDIWVPSLSSAEFGHVTGLFYPKYDQQFFLKYLEVLDVNPRLQMDTLSYGQQKKVMIAFGLATNTSLLLMDEPTNGLDISSKVQFRKLIASALTEDRCVVMSTHQVRDLESLIDTLLILHGREITINMSIESITEKLYFETLQGLPGGPILYEEKI